MRDDRLTIVSLGDMSRDPVAMMACAKYNPTKAIGEDMVDHQVEKRPAIDRGHGFWAILQDRREPGSQASAENDNVGRCMRHQAASFFHV
ncbi:hypothetical protein NITLEN_30078 [Nitrospira lenta]|uniref:Uncharacterized protein n=1 Tax=Nitrospira lenta TaxID=1436998 RepID=A0A330L5X4_9BACT|nr:hypothetical protein NITLEN_30078 [Nitrospira lenta]